MFDVLIPVAPSGPYEAHQLIAARLDTLGITEKCLFCIDPLKPGRIVLRTQAQIAAVLGEVRQLPTIERDRDFDFCIRVSPMCRIGGQRMPAIDLVQWCQTHFSERCGIEVIRLFSQSSMTFVSRPPGFTLPDVVMVGHLRVIDPDTFVPKLTTGIGRHRAFGYGLLQLFERGNHHG